MRDCQFIVMIDVQTVQLHQSQWLFTCEYTLIIVDRSFSLLSTVHFHTGWRCFIAVICLFISMFVYRFSPLQTAAAVRLYGVASQRTTRLRVYVMYLPAHCEGVSNKSPRDNLSPRCEDISPSRRMRSSSASQKETTGLLFSLTTYISMCSCLQARSGGDRTGPLVRSTFLLVTLSKMMPNIKNS